MTMILLGRKESFRQLNEPLRQAADSGYQRGDVVYATYCASQSFHMHNYLGTHLETVEASMRARYDLVSNLSQDGMILWFQPAQQYVINMQSDVTNLGLTDFSGEIMNEEEYFRQVEDSSKHLLLTIIGSAWSRLRLQAILTSTLLR
jgi:hypothetical protein